MGSAACGLVAGLIYRIEGPASDRGRPRCPAEAAVEMLRFMVCEGVRWSDLRATHAVSPGPLATRAASSIPDFDALMSRVADGAPSRSRCGA
jgi:hypothetical protein